MSACVFCRIIAGDEPAHTIAHWPEAIAIVPLKPVVDGHFLVIPRAHVPDAAADPLLAGVTAVRAAELANRLVDGDFNLMTSVGANATQTIRHLHWHIVPRRPGDGLALPWSPR